jgi:hypothetical protein
MPSDVGAIWVTLVARSEFELARALIAGFEPWATYDDYRSERDGRILGLAAAGLRARPARVSVSGFVEWSAANGVGRTLEELEAFAARSTRSVSASRRRSRAAASRLVTIDLDAGVVVDAAAYREWLACLREQPSDELLAAYRALMVESRGGHGRPSAGAD